MWLLGVIDSTMAQSKMMSFPHHSSTSAHMDVLMLVRFLSAFAILLFWGIAKESRPARLLLAACLAVQGIGGLVSGAWSLGFLAFTASTMMLRWWYSERNGAGWSKHAWRRAFATHHASQETGTRLTQLFDPGTN